MEEERKQILGRELQKYFRVIDAKGAFAVWQAIDYVGPSVWENAIRNAIRIAEETPIEVPLEEKPNKTSGDLTPTSYVVSDFVFNGKLVDIKTDKEFFHQIDLEGATPTFTMRVECGWKEQELSNFIEGIERDLIQEKIVELLKTEMDDLEDRGIIRGRYEKDDFLKWKYLYRYVSINERWF